MFRPGNVVKILVLFCLVVLLPPGSAPAETQPASEPHTLEYVESSQGLIPPELEGGRTEIEMGDVNADGNPDLVSIGDHGSPYVNTDEHGVMVWFGDGAGNWGVYQTGDFGYGGIALGDVNGDGLVDVGYGMHHNYSGIDFGDQLMEVALGDGSGQAWTPWDDGLATNGEDWGMFSTDFADVDNDGDLDFGSVSFGCCNGVHVYLNQGDGTWVQSFSDGHNNGYSDMHFVFGDVNGDGNADLAVSYDYGDVYVGDGSGGFTNEDGNLPGGLLEGVSLGDVNQDGRAELAFCDSAGGTQVWGWVAPGEWQDLSGELPDSGSCEATQLADMDRDGYLDVVMYGGRQVRVWGGNGGGSWTEIASFTYPGTPGYFTAFRAGGDADHNGYLDITIIASEGPWYNEQNHLRFYKEASVPEILAISPVFPHGGEVFKAGGTQFIDWVSAVPGGGTASVDLELSIQGPEGPWTPIASGLPNGGRYQWQIPADTFATQDAYLRYTLTATETVQAVTPAAFTILGITEQPITGLEAFNDSPTELGQPTAFTATITGGTNVSYAWDFGDGLAGEGQTITHTYGAAGVFTATVTAANSISELTATTPVSVIDMTPPQVLATQPYSGAVDVALDTTLVITFSEAISQPTFSYTVTPDPGGWSLFWNETDRAVSLEHTPFSFATIYTVAVTAADLAGNPLSDAYAWEFSTPPQPDLTPPQVLATHPISGATGVALDATLVITFSEPISQPTFGYQVMPDPGGWIASWNPEDNSVRLEHAPFDYSTPYLATVTAATDLAGNPLPGPFAWQFSTLPCRFWVYVPVLFSASP